MLNNVCTIGTSAYACTPQTQFMLLPVERISVTAHDFLAAFQRKQTLFCSAGNFYGASSSAS